jgi:hypothetical protein
MNQEKFYLVETATNQVMSDLADWNLNIIRDALAFYFASMTEQEIKEITHA